jgi:hypothetical protein
MYSGYVRLVTVLLAVVAMSGCELVEGIFKAGMAAGIFLVFLVVALVIFLVSKVRRHV